MKLLMLYFVLNPIYRSFCQENDMNERILQTNINNINNYFTKISTLNINSKAVVGGRIIYEKQSNNLIHSYIDASDHLKINKVDTATSPYSAVVSYDLGVINTSINTSLININFTYLTNFRIITYNVNTTPPETITASFYYMDGTQAIADSAYNGYEVINRSLVKTGTSTDIKSKLIDTVYICSNTKVMIASINKLY